MSRPSRNKLPRVSEKAEQAAIVKLLQSIGAHVYPLSQPRATMQAEGLPDLWVFMPATNDRRSSIRSALWIEVKALDGTMRPKQELFKNLCDEHEVTHLVAFGVDGMIAYLTEGGWLRGQ